MAWRLASYHVCPCLICKYCRFCGHNSGPPSAMCSVCQFLPQHREHTQIAHLQTWLRKARMYTTVAMHRVIISTCTLTKSLHETPMQGECSERVPLSCLGRRGGLKLNCKSSSLSVVLQCSTQYGRPTEPVSGGVLSRPVATADLSRALCGCSDWSLVRCLLATPTSPL